MLCTYGDPWRLPFLRAVSRLFVRRNGGEYRQVHAVDSGGGVSETPCTTVAYWNRA